MKYTVLWTPTAEQDLAAIWMDAQDRNAVTSAASSIDALLGEQADTQGESRYGKVRIMFAPPLGVEFEALEEDRTVYVLAVWAFHTGRSSS
jgi:plasmid stabilization system protein ParE